jgi:hypothetical protein
MSLYKTIKEFAQLKAEVAEKFNIPADQLRIID